ncbi:MAG: type 1 glutamine amidotransferase [Desulfofustis sp.]|nr:type 1 glutamine amidotransferase [Desulfofustis sp.]NNK14373.1 type 1 glutamine amidotransferase [Desulfofustis sp.]
MHIHWLQHVPFEGLGIIDSWAASCGHTLSCTKFWDGDGLPAPDALDMLVVMGGPMGVDDEVEYPWLEEEKAFLRQAVEQKRVILGICLGAQLLASVCGASVYPHREKEIGWFPVTLDSGAPGWIKTIIPSEFTAFHWHGDTFDIPETAELICTSAACKNQGYVIGDRIIGLQFHPEMNGEGVAALTDNCRTELISSTWVQSEQQILEGRHHLAAANTIMEKLLDHCARCAAGA